MKTILVTELEYRKAQSVFEAETGFRCLSAPAEEKLLAEAVIREQAFGVIVGVDRYSRELYEALPSGGIIARFGVGHDGVDKKLAAERGIFCTNTPGVLEQSVAECAVGMMFMAARRFAGCAADNRRGVWRNRIGFELSGRTLVIAGCGRIGCKTAAIAKNGLGMRVVGCDVAEPKQPEYFDFFTRDRQEAFRQADILSLHIPDLPATRDYINAESLSWLKPSAWLINTSRGGVLQEDDLYDHVAAGKIAGAVLDVFKKEPYEPMSPGKDLRKLESVIMLPHLGSSTAEACERMARSALENVQNAAEKNYSGMALLQPAPEGVMKTGN